MRLPQFAAVLLATAILATGCSAPAGSVSVTAGPTAAAAPAVGSSLGPAEFASAAKRADTVLLDVRTPAEFATGHLPGAMNLDGESAEFATLVGQLDTAKNYAVYCRSGNRSKVAMTALQQLGITSAFDLSGGIGAWQSAGGEIVTD